MKKVLVGSRSSSPVRRAKTSSAAPAVRGRVLDPNQVLVRDVMRRDVLLLRADDPIHAAAEQLEDARCSGAPVLGAGGRLVGVLTLADIARSEHVTDSGVVARPRGRPVEEVADVTPSDDGDEEEPGYAPDEYPDELLGGLRVADWMTPRVIETTPEVPLAAACRLMLDEGIHRVFVHDGEALVGVVSAEEIVRWLAGEAPAAKPAAAKPAGRRTRAAH